MTENSTLNTMYSERYKDYTPDTIGVLVASAKVQLKDDLQQAYSAQTRAEEALYEVKVTTPFSSKAIMQKTEVFNTASAKVQALQDLGKELVW